MPSPPEDCFFCRIARDGPHVARSNGFVAVEDIHPQAPVHLLVIPERHVDTFREIDEFSAARPSTCSSSSPRPRVTPA